MSSGRLQATKKSIQRDFSIIDSTDYIVWLNASLTFKIVYFFFFALLAHQRLTIHFFITSNEQFVIKELLNLIARALSDNQCQMLTAISA